MVEATPRRLSALELQAAFERPMIKLAPIPNRTPEQRRKVILGVLEGCTLPMTIYALNRGLGRLDRALMPEEEAPGIELSERGVELKEPGK